MLTNNDLSSIGEMVDEKLDPIKKDVAKINSSITKINSSITKIQKDQTTIVNYFDREDLGLNKRVKRIEDYLHLPVIQ